MKPDSILMFRKEQCKVKQGRGVTSDLGLHYQRKAVANLSGIFLCIGPMSSRNSQHLYIELFLFLAIENHLGTKLA